MVRVGRILLVLLFVATLLTANQISPKAEIAEAQIPPPPAITILTDNLTFSVTGSGVGSATQAKVSYQTQKVYVNGIKLKNTTATSQPFNVQVGFDVDHNGSAPGLGDVPMIGSYTGYDGCGGYRSFSGTLNANETREVPLNRACADIAYYARQTNGNGAQNVFQVATFKGWNTADLMVSIDPAYYNSWINNTQKIANALIWPAAKVTVTDILANPSQYTLSLRLPDSTTRLGLGKTLYFTGGATQYFGAALLDTPGPNTKYIITTTGTTGNEQIKIGLFTATDYAMYQQTVSATKPWVTLTASPETIAAGQSSTLSWESGNAQTLTIDNGVGAVTPLATGTRQVTPTQTTTYTITAIGQGGSAFASTRVTIGLPDLEIDLDNLRAIVDGQVSDRARVSADTNELKITGVKVKNIGDAAAPTGVILLAGFESVDSEELRVPVTLPAIPAGQSVNVTDINLLSLWKTMQRLGITGLMAQSPYANLVFEVNPGAPGLITEKDYGNNKADISPFVFWPSAVVTIVTKGLGTPVREAIVTLSRGSSKRTELTNSQGLAYFGTLANPSEITDYAVEVAFDGEGNLGRGVINVRDYIYHSLTIEIAPKDGLVISPQPQQPDEEESKPSSFVDFAVGKAASGQVSIEVAESGEILKQDLVDGKAKFTDLKSGTKVVVKSLDTILKFNVGDLIKDQKVTFRYDVKKDGPYEITYGGGRQDEFVYIKLTTNCDTTTKNGQIRLCLYEDEENITEAKQTYLPIFASQLDRMTNFTASTALTITKEVWIMPIVSGIGHFDSTKPQYIFATSRYAAKDNLFAKDLIMHEAMHALDYQIGGFYSERNEAYSQSSALTANGGGYGLTAKTGAWTWQNLGWMCGYVSAGLKSSCAGHDDPTDGPAEIWAEQMTVMCQLPQELKRRIANHPSVYQSNPMKDQNGNPLPPPSDLTDHVAMLASRSTGDTGLGRGNIIWGFNLDGSYKTFMSLFVWRIANSCDPGVTGTP